MLFSFCSSGDRKARVNGCLKYQTFVREKDTMSLKKFRALPESNSYLQRCGSSDGVSPLWNDWTLVLEPVNLCNRQIGV